jgi:hypothetical protein
MESDADTRGQAAVESTHWGARRKGLESSRGLGPCAIHSDWAARLPGTDKWRVQRGREVLGQVPEHGHPSSAVGIRYACTSWSGRRSQSKRLFENRHAPCSVA